MTMPVGCGGGAMCGGVREEVGPVTYLLPLPTHTRLTELEEEEESGRASQIGSESEWPPMPNRRSFVLPSMEHVATPAGWIICSERWVGLTLIFTVPPTF